MKPTWQQRRSLFNHSWLKNEYIPGIVKLINLLNNKLEDENYEQRFISDVFPEWENKLPLLRNLLSEFVKEMSPSTILGKYISSSHKNKSPENWKWIDDLIHRLWMFRYDINLLIENTEKEIKRVDRIYNTIQSSLMKNRDETNLVLLKQLKKEFISLKIKCISLAKAIEKFPDEVKVI